jgi:hypothetical protein
MAKMNPMSTSSCKNTAAGSSNKGILMATACCYRNSLFAEASSIIAKQLQQQ